MAEEFKSCGKEQPAGAEIYVCGTPNLREPNNPWHCKKCIKKYARHLESVIAEKDQTIENLMKEQNRITSVAQEI